MHGYAREAAKQSSSLTDPVVLSTVVAVVEKAVKFQQPSPVDPTFTSLNAAAVEKGMSPVVTRLTANITECLQITLRKHAHAHHHHHIHRFFFFRNRLSTFVRLISPVSLKAVLICVEQILNGTCRFAKRSYDTLDHFHLNTCEFTCNGPQMMYLHFQENVPQGALQFRGTDLTVWLD